MEKHLKEDTRLSEMLFHLSESYILVVASNAVEETVKLGLKLLKIEEYISFVYSNKSVTNIKPNPEIYLAAMMEAGVSPAETLIVEDSKHGREAAMASGAHVCGVDSPEDLLTGDKLERAIERANKPQKIKWAGRDVTVLIPMAGAGSRFKEAGYAFPKPLIDVNGKPMIQRVIENLNIDANFVFVVQREHYYKYCLDYLLKAIVPGCRVIPIEGITEGAACTALLAKEWINNDDHLLIANSDQLLEWDSCDFFYNMISQNLDGGIVTFQDSNPKWSFCRVDDQGFVTETAEKTPISDIASTGIYYYKRGRDFVKFAEERESQGIRFNNEYYICPVYNNLINAGGRVKTYNAGMIGLGDPESLQSYLNGPKSEF
jgi:dTDP-glucose pyrophosphorylase